MLLLEPDFVGIKLADIAWSRHVKFPDADPVVDSLDTDSQLFGH